jgi:hypothetical protein
MRNELQQCLSGFKTVAVIGGPLIVRVHEALDAGYEGTPDRYFISVDFKFRASDALNIGQIGWFGCRKTEATREANALAKSIASCHSVMLSAVARAESDGSPTARTTARIQSERFEKVIAKYTAEFIQD